MELDMTLSFDGEDAEESTFTNIAISDVILAADQSNMTLFYGSISNDVSDKNAEIETLKNISVLKMAQTDSLEELTDNES